MEGNWFATAALLSSPIFAIILFRTLPAGQAAMWTIFGGQLLLPVGAAIKFAMIPQFDKASIPNICALIGCLAVGRSQAQRWRFGITEVLMAGYILAPIAT